MSSNDRVVVSVCASVIEAEAMKSVLDAAGIEAFVETEHLGTILPHQTDALGGVRITVWAKDELAARELLEKDTTSDPKDKGYYEYSRAMKNALAGAIFGAFIVPVVGAGFSLWHLYRAFQMRPDEFKRSYIRVGIALLFDVLGLYVSFVMLQIFMKG